MFPFGGGGFGLALGPFEANYRCYPVTFIDKPEAETGDKIFLPPSALDRLSSMHVEYPMLFSVTNRATGGSTHCGVLEFIADEGHVYMPYWMMQNLVLTEGDMVRIRSASLPKGTYVKLQPHTTDFINISNPKARLCLATSAFAAGIVWQWHRKHAVLETTLRGYSCLTIGDAICVHYNNKKYFIDVIEALPANAISVIDTDCQVDFAQPLDYTEPQRPAPQPAPQPAAEEAGLSTSAAEPEGPTFLAFAGSGQRLDGKSAAPAAPVPVRLGTYEGGYRSAQETTSAIVPPEKPASNGKAAPGDTKKAGKVVFGGGNRLLAAKEKEKTPPKLKEEEKKEDGPGFKAFGGKPNKLR